MYISGLWFKIISPPDRFRNLHVLLAAILSTMSLEQSAEQVSVPDKLPILSTLVSTLVETIGLENSNLRLDKLIQILPNYELQLDESTKVLLNFQANFFHYKTGKFLASIPEQFNPTLRQIYLVSDIPLFEGLVLYYMPSLEKFIKKFGKFCFYCKKCFTSRGCNHKCSKVVCCFSCKRPFLHPNTFVTSETKSYFCNSSLCPSQSQTCQACNVFYFSQECFAEHKKKVCRWGWKCLICNIYQGRNGFFKTQEEIKSKHICGKRFCNFCGDTKEKFHFCSLKRYPLPTEYTNLAFVSFAYSGFNVAKCLACYRKNDGLPCESCPKNDEAPLSCIILQENEGRNTFSSNILNDDTLEEKVQDKNVKYNDIFMQYNYLPEFVDKKPKLAPEGRKTRFGQRQQTNKCSKLFAKPLMSLMDKFFHFLLNNKFTNSTIFVYSGMSKDMFFILQTLLDNGLSPKIVKNHNQIMLIDETTLSLRFVEVQNYLHCTFRDMCHRINCPIPYFPTQWIQKPFFDYIGVPPRLENYFDFEDTDEDIREKQKIVQKLGNLVWDFQKHFFNFLMLRVKIIALALLEFFKEAFHCQQILSLHLKKDPKSFYQFLHPANPPIFTAATYSFQLFLHMSTNKTTLKTVHPPIAFNSSKGEIEYIMYQMWKQQNLQITMAWSPYGQEKINFTKPDGISETEIWYYNGCYFHGHSLTQCKFKSKVPKEKRLAKEKEFTEMIKKVEKENPFKKINVMWECVWKQLKKTDEDVKFFLKHIFRNPPLSRLDAREAGKIHFNPILNVLLTILFFIVRGGLNEVYQLFWNKEDKKSEAMSYLDKNAFYCYMAMINFFPVGSYTILTFYDLQNIRFHNNTFEVQDGTKLFGLALVRILCPSKLFLPFLSYRSSATNRNCLPCCKMCADSRSLHCGHTIA